MNAEATYPNDGKLSVLEIMFEANSRVVSEPEEKQMFLREVLPIMISAGAKFNPTAYLLPTGYDSI